MKSKTSFFNSAVFKKNMSLFWPIWACYLLYGLIKVPGQLWYRLQQGKKLTETICYTAVGKCLNLEMDLLAIAVMAVICGMALFGYLFAQKSAYMIHALPVTRTELYFTNVISGLGFMFISQFLVFLVTVLLCIGKGISCVEFLGMWLLSVMGISFFLFSTVCFCVMFTGQLFALPVYFIAMNYVVFGISVGGRYVAGVLGFGLSVSDIRNPVVLQVLAPMNYLYEHVHLGSTTSYNDKKAIGTVLDFYGSRVVFAYVLAAIVIYALAFLGYRKRRIESAGDLLTFNWVKPVFRWGVGICTGYLAGVLAVHFLNTVLCSVGRPVMLCLVLFFSFIGFFVAEMFIEKGFRVFRKKALKECFIFLIFTACSFGGISAGTQYLEQFIPKENQIERAYICMNYPVEFKGGKIADAVTLHKELLSAADECRNRESINNTYVTVDYYLKNGKEITRSYSIPKDFSGNECLNQDIRKYEDDYENFMSYLGGCDYQSLSNFSGGTLGLDNSELYYRTVELDKQTAKLLYQALQADIKAGMVQKYNLSDQLVDDESALSYESTYFSLDFMHESVEWQDVFQRANGDHNELDGVMDANMLKSGTMYVNFGPDCENIVQTLVDCGVIESASDIHYSVMGETP